MPSYGASLPENPTRNCHRSVGGKLRTGVIFTFSIGPLAHEAEIYTIDHNGKTIAMVFQHAIEDKDKAEPRFAIVAEQFR